MITFSILIPIYNRLQVTREGLKALRRSLDQYAISGSAACRFEIVVIDDGSTDGSSTWIAANYPEIHIVQGTGNLWWSGAINRGSRYAIDHLNSDYLLLWNDDINPAADYFLQVEKIFLAHSFGDTIIGSKIVSKGAVDRIWSVGGYFNRVSGKYGMFVDPGTEPKEFFECDWLPGMGTFVPTSILKANGLDWDERRFPQYHGDSDFTLRCKDKGYKIKTCLSLVIYNSSETSGLGQINTLKDFWRSLSSIRSNNNINKRLIFYRQHGLPPFCYVGLVKTYVMTAGSFCKRKLLKF
jgi:GT2 family glycosyltransferase